MAFLVRVVAAASLLASCYSPDLRDCTVSCASSADCAGAQVCNASHMCAGKDVSCANMTTTPEDAAITSDASRPTDARQAPPIDAPRPIDAPGPVALHVRVDGGGGTVTAGTNSCDTDCTYQVTYGQPIALAATANGNHAFAGWTQGPCAGSFVPTCTVTPTAATNVTARFVHGGGGGD